MSVRDPENEFVDGSRIVRMGVAPEADAGRLKLRGQCVFDPTTDCSLPRDEMRPGSNQRPEHMIHVIRGIGERKYTFFTS